MVQTEDGVSKSVATPTLREFLTSQLHQGKTVLSSNPAKTINEMMDAIEANSNNIQDRDIDKIKEVLIEAIQNKTITKLDKRYVTLEYYKEYLPRVLVTLASNALILRGGVSDKLLKNLTGTWVTEGKIRKLTNDFVIDIPNCQITRRRLVDPNEILDYIPPSTPPSTRPSTPTREEKEPSAVPTEIPYTLDSVEDMIDKEVDNTPEGVIAVVLFTIYNGDVPKMARAVYDSGTKNEIPRRDLLDWFLTQLD